MSLDLCNSCLRFPDRKCGITIKFLPWVPAPKAKSIPVAGQPRISAKVAAPSLLRAPLVPSVKASPVVEKQRVVQREPEAEETAIVFKSAAHSVGCYDFIRA